MATLATPASPMNRAPLSLGVLFVLSIALISCSPVEDRQDRANDFLKGIGDTASGAVNDAGAQVNDLLNTGKSMTDGITQMINDAKRRFDQVQSGVNLLMQGKDMIEEGVKGEDEA
ncbi:MAG: hypothetical protein QF442_02215, partial [Candidatus Peribacteraceae bacterium]|nr:hypothetical protein [Candidatus Peribacteraceae bacterium]